MADSPVSIVKKMSAFETWQIITSIVQSAILLATLLAAIYIGLKQVEISDRQLGISEQQAAMSKNLAGLPFVVSVDVIHDAGMRRLVIINRGQTNIFLWGTKLGSGSKTVEAEPFLITPTGNYYVPADALDQQLRGAPGANVSITGVLETYLTNQADEKYIVRTTLLCERHGDVIQIHTQTRSIRREQW